MQAADPLGRMPAPLCLTHSQRIAFDLVTEAGLDRAQTLSWWKKSELRQMRKRPRHWSGFLAGVSGVVIELLPLCNGVPCGRGFPPPLLPGQQFLLLPPQLVPCTHESSKGNNSPDFLKVITAFKFITAKHCSPPSMLVHLPDKNSSLFQVFPYL